MRLELPVRLEDPLFICLVFIAVAGFNILDELGFGFWKYLIGLIIVITIMWSLQKSGLTEKEVPIWVGAFIIMSGITSAIIFESFVIANNS